MYLRRLTTLSLFCLIALTIFVAESFIPIPIPLPGIKLGLSNIVSLLVLLNYKTRDAFYVVFVRILLSSLFAGQLLYLFYSLCGGMLCLIIMSLVNRFLSGKYIFITSMFGALFHNIGQLGAAFIITGTIGVFTYLPFLIISGTLTGLFTGLCAYYGQKYLKKHMVLYQDKEAL